MVLRVLFSDDFHLNRRNFSSLYKYLERRGAQLEFLNTEGEMWNRYGDYSGVKPVTAYQQEAEYIIGKGPAYLVRHERLVCGASVPFFPLVVPEILSFANVNIEEVWRYPLPEDRLNLAEILFAVAPECVRDNVAAALFWADRYTHRFKHFNFDMAVVFSGSQIYQRLLIEILKTKKPRVFVTESFQTGSEFYWEERYSPISNNCEIRYRNVYNRITLPEDYLLRQNEIIKALNKIRNAKNKNVTQPGECLNLSFGEKKKTLLLSCQVQNDFSIIDSPNRFKNPYAFYEALIRTILLSSDYCVVVKTHPFESNKISIRRPFIYNALSEYIAGLTKNLRSRVTLVESVNLHQLVREVDGFITLNSQSAFEACFYGGLKPVVFGRPFYGGYGFTNDYEQLTDFRDDLEKDRIAWTLDCREFNSFVEFVTKLLQYQLASVHDSGISVIATRVERRERVVPSAAAVGRRRPVADGDMKTGPQLSAKRPSINATPGRRRRLLRKLRSKPDLFFSDAKAPYVRILRYAFTDHRFGRLNRRILECLIPERFG